MISEQKTLIWAKHNVYARLICKKLFGLSLNCMFQSQKFVKPLIIPAQGFVKWVSCEFVFNFWIMPFWGNFLSCTADSLCCGGTFAGHYRYLFFIVEVPSYNCPRTASASQMSWSHWIDCCTRNPSSHWRILMTELLDREKSNFSWPFFENLSCVDRGGLQLLLFFSLLIKHCSDSLITLT